MSLALIERNHRFRQTVFEFEVDVRNDNIGETLKALSFFLVDLGEPCRVIIDLQCQFLTPNLNPYIKESSTKS